MKHINYHEIVADSYLDLGVKEGKMFSRQLWNAIRKMKRSRNWDSKKRNANDYLPIAKKHFPHLIEELKGYAVSAEVEFDDIWALNLEGETSGYYRCTTAITNGGKLIAHNEDWDISSVDDICIVKKTLPDITIFELFYYNTVGGSAISINSNGIVQTINSLSYSDRQSNGITKNFIARWLSETDNPVSDFKKLAGFQRSGGYSHNLISTHGTMWNIEASAKKQILTEVTSPYVHTNHYMSELKYLDRSNNREGTYSRLKSAYRNIGEKMTVDQMIRLMSDTSLGKSLSLFNRRTIARMVVDLNTMKSFVWLLRERQKGWVEYSLDFIKK